MRNLDYKDLLQKGVELIMVAGGMSVDPDDVTRMAIVEARAEDVAYGTPVLPGAMFLYGRFGKTPVLGIPACVLFYKATILNLVLPRVLAGEAITRRDLATMAHGGLCLNCEQCHYPICPFGKQDHQSAGFPPAIHRGGSIRLDMACRICR